MAKPISLPHSLTLYRVSRVSSYYLTTLLSPLGGLDISPMLWDIIRRNHLDGTNVDCSIFHLHFLLGQCVSRADLSVIKLENAEIKRNDRAYRARGDSRTLVTCNMAIRGLFRCRQ